MENEDIKETKQIKQVRRCRWMCIIVPIIGLAIGFYKGKQFAYNEFDILYISQAEILNLEKKRASDVSDNQLFYGKPEVAIKHIEKLQKEMSQKGHYILLTDSKIYGSNVRSISKQIHQQIVKRLDEGVKNE